MAAHVKVGYGGPVGGISSPANPKSYRLGAHNEEAREVLFRALRLLNDPTAQTWIPQRLTWLPFHDFSDNAYALNIHSFPDRSSAAVDTGVSQTSLRGSVDSVGASNRK